MFYRNNYNYNKMHIEFNIDDFPLLKDIKEEELNNTLLKLLKTGYNIHFPNINTDTNTVTDSNTNIVTDTNTNDNLLYNKITNLEFSLNKLIGISSNSQKKGNFAENVLEDIFETRYGDIKFERKNYTPHSGDAWLYLPDNSIIILESKNYTTTVNKDEITKLQNDMITNHIKWAILASFNSQIQGMKELDYHTFTHNKETYSILTVSNLSSDIHKLDLILQIIRKLMLCSIKTNYNIIIKDVNENLLELDKIIQKNYMLRDSYINMEKDIQKSLSTHYNILRDYQYDIEKKINYIINKMNVKEENEIDKLLKDNKDKKIFPILSRLCDIINNKKWTISNDKIMNNDVCIGIIKIQIKKIVINIVENDIIINLNIGNEKEIKKNLDMITLI